MRRWTPLLAGLGAAALLAVGAGTSAAPVDDLIAAQTRLVDRAREYRASLDPVLAIEEAEAARLDAQAASRRALFERGLIARREAEDSQAAAEGARAKAEATRRRMAEAEALMSETLAAIELARMPPASRSELVSTPTVLRYQGTAALGPEGVESLEAFFAGEFGRPLPVSALGQTSVHDRLGLDHRHAIDVALHPDSEAGRALIAYLKREHIPFLAFRGPVPGASTGAHIHIGQVSPRIVPVRTTGG